MKKIIISLCLVALVVTMAFPVFAYDGEYLAFPTGTFLWSDNLIDTTTSITHINFICNGRQFREISTGQYLNEESMHVNYTDEFGDWITVYANGVWVNDVYRQISIVEEQELPDYFVAYVSANGEWVCDGSSCPATDVDLDGVCDDCGLMLMRSVAPETPTYPDPYTVWTEERQATFPYAFLYEANGNAYLYLTSKRPYTIGDSFLRIPNKADGTSYAVYTIFGDSWRLSNSYEDGNDLLIEGKVSPSFNVMNEDDTLIVISQDTHFFPIPLWMIPSQVTQGGMVTGVLEPTIQTLIHCGVGLIVSLISLVIFFKVFSIFRP